MNRHIVGVQQWTVAFFVRALLGRQLRHPRGLLSAVDLACGFGSQLLQHKFRVTNDSHFDTAVMANFLAIEIDVNELRLWREAWRTEEGEHRIGTRTNH